MEPKTHFTALLTFVSEKEGGRSTPSSSGYRALLKFGFVQKETIGIFTFPDDELVFPGDTVSAEVVLSDLENVKDKLYQGLDFEMFENDVLVGNGVVKKLH